ncbi:MAG: CocE/NonD family hydrolase [Sphingobium sp.]|uniref:CocE/NonD family hydrolase n=1 Tax=Sphingobium sp. TaxID=1912891 RepID=UPI0029A1FC75|nr:CocE/NonD family hydrolase [Sphingobium sp.]MDX3909275.1 CocE/NonD family hydrolase [Sphingobium sp.]
MQFIYEPDTFISMSDGTKLCANVWRPAEGRGPTLLLRVPYGKDVGPWLGQGMIPSLLGFLRAGYAVVMQDTRGTFRSEGQFTPKVDEPADGRDTVEWIVRQPWSDGTVGTYGPSYLGMVQWAAASERPPALKATAPMVAAMEWYEGLWYSPGGALSLSVVSWWHTMMYAFEAQRELAAGRGDMAELIALGNTMSAGLPTNRVTPVAENPVFRRGNWLDDILDHPDYDDFWKKQDFRPAIPQMTAPPLCLAGWYDLFVNASVKDFVKFRAGAATEEARAGARLVIGPWDHLNYTGRYPDRDFGLAASSDMVDSSAVHVRHFDRWLRGDVSANANDAPVRIFVMGIDQWRDEQEWPLPDTQYVEYFLGGEGPANTSAGAGTLTREAPGEDRRDTLLYDPSRPVPTAGGSLLPDGFGFIGPVDQRRIDGRDDILCFASPVLDHDVEVTGFVKMRLFVSSSAVDTDFTAKLVDVFPDGRAINLCDGIIRMRYREGLSSPTMMEPGRVYEAEIDMQVTSNVFLAGHRIRVDISSSNFPRYDRNSNTGGFIAREAEKDMLVAVNRVHHGALYPSRLILPVIER